ncbi:MAG: hypothetical protein A2319_01745 [Candidatus Kerfeldbacteria bacterium RIFOXYB2_FULL_38_14]|uniref:Uncharacterized protein n=1 Tax=Candidatus Kerfeldbacteria bacterium RIFOXYB2_FULL_38_14 TaxID=1798547 RepID=A0A1G2BG76_9BACT|nr:MAG: hypothetical protein A2319_01745 [Candidatus Kerfeldbacteria bacterium RIFOXYB2_FULL_38_14]
MIETSFEHPLKKLETQIAEMSGPEKAAMASVLSVVGEPETFKGIETDEKTGLHLAEGIKPSPTVLKTAERVKARLAA